MFCVFEEGIAYTKYQPGHIELRRGVPNRATANAICMSETTLLNGCSVHLCLGVLLAKLHKTVELKSMIRWKSVIPFGLGVDQHRVYDRGDTCIHHVKGKKGVDETYQKFVVVYEERSELAVLKRELFAPAESLAGKGAPSSCPSAARQLSMGLLHAPFPPAASMRLPYNRSTTTSPCPCNHGRLEELC
jgi:hypothetical protein